MVDLVLGMPDYYITLLTVARTYNSARNACLNFEVKIKKFLRIHLLSSP